MPTAKKNKIVNPIKVDQKVVDAVHVLQDNGLNVDAIEVQLVDNAIEDIKNGSLLIEGMTEHQAMDSVQCCPGLG